MLMLDRKCLRITRLSISVPARKVSRIAPKPARKLTQSVRSSPMTLPATAPTMISMRATETATRIEMIEASRARPSQTADASHTFSIRSEEHTSELQSLMRISYAVFCLKKKTHKKTKKKQTQHKTARDH